MDEQKKHSIDYGRLNQSIKSRVEWILRRSGQGIITIKIGNGRIKKIDAGASITFWMDQPPPTPEQVTRFHGKDEEDYEDEE